MKDATSGPDVIVIGAGPVGVAAAAHLRARGLRPLVLEMGLRAGHAIAEWGHVRVFTPWRYITDKTVISLLEKSGWEHPDEDVLPTGQEIVDQYLVPAANVRELENCIIYGAKVVAVSKRGLSKSSSQEREDAPFTVHYDTVDGQRQVIEADAVVDASGTWYSPNPIGTDGLPVSGEVELSDYITYGIPDALNTEKSRYDGKRTLVLGGGHSAINAALDILRLKEDNPDTKIVWGLRGTNMERLMGGGVNDQLPERGALGMAAKNAIDEGALELIASMGVRQISKKDDHLRVDLLVEGVARSVRVDRIIVATGFRPDMQMLRELRLDLDEIVEAPTKLAPMIDPNLHSCGTVKPHGVDELAHHDKNFFIVGMKSYGRAPTFLMLTGYEQVRSIAAELAGDHAAARKVELNLPETGVCNTRPQTSVAGGGSCASDVPVDDQTNTAGGGCCAPSRQKVGDVEDYRGHSSINDLQAPK